MYFAYNINYVILYQVFQKRYDGSVDFTGTFKKYEDGFGALDGEFWLGNY